MNAEKKELRKSKIKDFCTKHEKLIINVVGFTATVAALIVVDNIVNPKKTYSITEARYYVHETKTKPIIYLECAVNDLRLKDAGKLGKTLSENYALNGSDEISAILAIHVNRRGKCDRVIPGRARYCPAEIDEADKLVSR